MTFYVEMLRGALELVWHVLPPVVLTAPHTQTLMWPPML